MQAARSGNSRRSCDVGSHPSTADDSTETQCSPHDRISEREVSNPDIQRLSAGEEEFYRQALLGKRVLCEHSWIRGKADSRLYSGSGARREAARADAIVRSLTIAPSKGFHQTTRYAGGI